MARAYVGEFSLTPSPQSNELYAECTWNSFFLFLFFLSSPLFLFSLSLSLVPSFASLYLYPSNFQRRRLEEKKRTCTNNPDLSFLVFSFFLFLVSSLVLAGRFRNFFGIEVSRNRGGGGGRKGGDSRVRLFVKRHPPPFFPTRTISFAFSLF